MSETNRLTEVKITEYLPPLIFKAIGKEEEALFSVEDFLWELEFLRYHKIGQQM